MTTFRFIHTGDIHLDSPLKGLAGHEGATAERIRTATRAAFINLIDYAIEETIEFVVIAGDLYDGDWRDYNTGLFFIGQMGRLAKANIPVFLSYGNHDAESQITKRLVLPENVKVFSSRKPQMFEHAALKVALHGQSFKQRDVTDNLVPAYPAPIAGSFNIGVLHTGLGGMGGHLNYAPCSLDDLVNKGYDYWALAHVHQGATLHQNPHVVFCGNLQGRHIRESGIKSASVVTVQDGAVTDIFPLECDVVRWAGVTVPVEDCLQISDVIDRIHRAVSHAATNDGAGRLLACRVALTGRTGLHGQLVASSELLTAEGRAAALALGDEAAWVERVVIGTKMRVDPATLLMRQDALSDLQSFMAEAAADQTLRSQLESDVGELVRKLPHDARTDLEEGVLKAAIGGNYADVVDQASRYLMARLTTTDGA